MHRSAWLMLLSLLLSSGCYKAGETETRQGRNVDRWGRTPDPSLRPVADTRAPTVGRLMREDFLIVGEREASCDAGPFATCDGFDALYLGKPIQEGEPDLADYACPGTKAPSDQWRCRKLDPPYVPNDGFAPVAQNGS